MMKPFEIFSTTADVGIRISGADYRELYRNAVMGFNELVFGYGAEMERLDEQIPEYRDWEFSGDSPENVLVNLLSEVSFLLYTRGNITKEMDISEAGEDRMRVQFLLVPLPEEINPELEVTSVTYHNLKVAEQNNYKTAEIIVDI